ncbi:MAG: diguanylate cyclase [Firmicutes bacterium]|nr:diguanylate cyclase [Bacillota bacterium]
MRVLLADDSMTILKVVGSLLESEGFEVITASDGVEAAIKAFSERPDLILLDVTMPKMNGYQVCRLLKNEPATQAIPIIILTSKDQPREKFWGYQTGADKYVTKGFDQGPLLAAVKELTVGRAEAAAGLAEPSGDLIADEFDILARSNDLLDAKLFEATIINEIGKLATNLSTFQETVSGLFDLMANLGTFSAGVLAFSHGEEGLMLVKVLLNVDKGYLQDYRHYLEAKIKREHPESIPPAGYSWEVLDRAKTGIIPDTGEAEFDPQATCTVFLQSKGKVVGLLSVAGDKKRALRMDQSSLELFGVHGTVVVENAWLYEQIRQLSITDGLTKVYNRRYIEERLKEAIRLSRRHKASLSLVMMDVDHFKKVNDTYGHQAGDDVLKHLMEVCRTSTRATDILGRYGGEEFILVLPETDSQGAQIVAERIRAKVEAMPFPTCAGRIPITISLGLATFPAVSIDTAEAFIKAADLALYRAKESGRNRVVAYDPKVDGLPQEE